MSSLLYSECLFVRLFVGFHLSHTITEHLSFSIALPASIRFATHSIPLSTNRRSSACAATAGASSVWRRRTNPAPATWYCNQRLISAVLFKLWLSDLLVVGRAVICAFPSVFVCEFWGVSQLHQQLAIEWNCFNCPSPLALCV